MNDHVAKPIKVDELFTTLVRWIRRPAGTRAARAALGNDQLYDRLARMFVERETRFVERFVAARAAADGAAMTRLAHDLKSVAETLGAQALADAARALEQACADHAPAHTIGALLEIVSAELEPAFNGLRAPAAQEAG